MNRLSRRRSLPSVRALVAATALLLALTTFNAGTANAAAPRDGWGFGIADAGTTADQGLNFRHLDAKTFRIQMPWDTAGDAGEYARVRGLLSRARSLGVQQTVVSLDAGKYTPTPPDPRTWGTSVRQIYSDLSGYVDVWGVANEPNAGRGWLRMASETDLVGPTKLAGYYNELIRIVRAPAKVLGPEFHDYLDRNGTPIPVRDRSRSKVRLYIARYIEAGGGFGDYAGWHPYKGARLMNMAGTNDFVAALPAGVPIWISEIGSPIYVQFEDEELDENGRRRITIIDQSDEEQRDQVSWITGTLARHARVARLSYYQIQRGGSRSWDTSLMRSDGSVRPAWWNWCVAAHGDNPNARSCDLGARVVSYRRDGVTYLATRGPEGNVWMRTYSALAGWTPAWYSFGGDIAGDPAILSWGPGHLVIFARRASDGALVQRYMTNGVWNPGWERIGDWAIAGNPVPISWENGHVEVFARGTDGSLIHTYFGSGRWHPWQSRGGPIQGDPSAISWAPGMTDVYVRGSDNAIHHTYFANGAWSAYEGIGGSAAGDPTAMTWGSGHNDVFIRGTDGGLYHRFFGSGQWSPNWERIGGSWQIASDPTVIVTGSGKADVHARGMNDQLIHTWIGGDGTWQPFEQLAGTPISGRPSGVATGGDGEEVFARGVDSTVLNRWFPTPAGWNPWNVLGSPGAE